MLDPNFGIQLGGLDDPLHHLHQAKSPTPSTVNYNPSVYTDNGKRSGMKGCTSTYATMS